MHFRLLKCQGALKIFALIQCKTVIVFSLNFIGAEVSTDNPSYSYRKGGKCTFWLNLIQVI